MSKATATAQAPGPTPMERLPPGRHGLPPERVRESQRLRLTAAATAALAERGYAGVTVTEIAKRAGVSTSSFYKHFGDLWACVLAAYEEGAERLGEQVEAACGEAEGGRGAQAAIEAALALLAAEPALAQSAEQRSTGSLRRPLGRAPEPHFPARRDAAGRPRRPGRRRA